MTTPERKIIAKECKHVIYGVDKESMDDYVFIKERIHYSDGTTEPACRIHRNFKRSFYVTHKQHRNHQDKKEWEDANKLQVFHCTDRLLNRRIAQALDRPNSSYKQLARSPYVYGSDITAPVLVKKKYMDQYPTAITDSTVASIDLEWCVAPIGTMEREEPIMGSITFKDRAYLVVRKELMLRTPNARQAIYDAFDLHMAEEKKARNIKLDVVFADTAGEMCAMLIAKAHEWGPDFVIAWNLKSDLSVIIKWLERERYDLEEVFSDPSLPPNLRNFDMRWGEAVQTKSNGDTQTKSPEEQWHWLTAPAKFIMLDAMGVYHRLRMAKGKQPSYKLDKILEKHLGIHKLSFDLPDVVNLTPSSEPWHIKMQNEHPVEYAIYNLADNIRLEQLDEKTTDVMRLVPLQCQYSEYKKFSSQTKRTWDDFHFLCHEEKKVECATSDQMEHHLDDMVTSLDGWIVTLASHHILEEDGAKLLRELPDQSTNVRLAVADLDITATYPTEEIIFNISKETTAMELSSIYGLDEATKRAFGVNLTGGTVNAIELCVSAFGAPTLSDLLDAYDREAA